MRTWPTRSMDGYPAGEFNFNASCSSPPTRLDGPHLWPPDPGWHPHSDGVLELFIGAASMGAIVGYYLRQLR